MTRAQLRMPAYGRALFDERTAGRHPDGAWILAGDDWDRRPRGLPSLCIGGDWRPGSTDWRMVAGLPVRLVCRWPFADAPDAHALGWLPLLSLAGELASVAAPVTLHWLDADWPTGWGRCGADAADLARQTALEWADLVGADRLCSAPLAATEWAAYQRRALREWPAPWNWRLFDDYQRRAAVWGQAATVARAA